MVAENHSTYPEHFGYYQRTMRSERLAGNVHVSEVITYPSGAQDTAVLPFRRCSLQETAKTAEEIEQSHDSNRSKPHQATNWVCLESTLLSRSKPKLQLIVDEDQEFYSLHSWDPS
jgi:hypothetical protein